MITDRLKVRIDVLMPFQKESPAVLNSKFLNEVQIQSLIPQTELKFRILIRESLPDTDFPSQRVFQKLTPLKVKFQNPQWSFVDLSFIIPSGAS